MTYVARRQIANFADDVLACLHDLGYRIVEDRRG